MAMQLRSRRRQVSPVPAPRGGVPRAQHGPDGGDAEGEDRLSNLPRELRREVLVRLGCAREAARTSVLSTRWRRLWAELRDLTFFNTVHPDSIAAALTAMVHPNLLRDLTFDGVDPDSVGAALAMVRPELRRLCIRDDRTSRRHSAARISSLLRAAERLAPAELVVALNKDCWDDAPFEMPCFERATLIDLFIQGLTFTPPPAGNFDRLEQLSLRHGLLNPGDLLHRCPRLRKLEMVGFCPLEMTTLTIESASLEELMLQCRLGPVVDIVAPELKKLTLNCWSGEFTVSLSAPKLEEFQLDYTCEHYSWVGSGVKWRLVHLKMATAWSDRHGQQGQLPRVRELVLSLSIHAHRKNLPDAKRSFQQEVAGFPLTDFSVLDLLLLTRGHVYGAPVLELLRIQTTVRRFKVEAVIMYEECSENCDCDHASSWRNEQISLPDLEVLNFEGFHGAGHEVDLLKLLFRSAPMLKTVTIKLLHELSSNNRVCQELCSILEANASVKCDVYDSYGDKISFQD